MIFCSIHQRLISLCDDGHGRVAAFSQRHLDRCPRCQDAFARERALGARLASTAAAERRAPNPFLAGKIISRLQRDDAIWTASPVKPVPRWTLGLVTVAIVALTAIVFVQLQPGEESNVAVAGGSLWPSSAARVYEQLGGRSADVVFDLTQTLDDPLKKEMALVLQDTKAAFAGLVQNFVPDSIVDGTAVGRR